MKRTDTFDTFMDRIHRAARYQEQCFEKARWFRWALRWPRLRHFLLGVTRHRFSTPCSRELWVPDGKGWRRETCGFFEWSTQRLSRDEDTYYCGRCGLYRGGYKHENVGG